MAVPKWGRLCPRVEVGLRKFSGGVIMANKERKKGSEDKKKIGRASCRERVSSPV